MTLRVFVYENFLRRERRLVFAKNWPEAMAIALDCLESSENTLMVRCWPLAPVNYDTAPGG